MSATEAQASSGWERALLQWSRSRDFRASVIRVAALTGAFFLFDDLLSWLGQRGGFASVVSAAQSLAARPAAVDVDENGLRLPIILILSLAGGSVVIDSEPGAGTTITLFLPRSYKVVAATRVPDGDLQSASPGQTVLLVEMLAILRCWGRLLTQG